jgi:hypothetical protein
VGKNRFRVAAIPMNRTATLGAISPDHYLIPRKITGNQYDPAKPRGLENCVEESDRKRGARVAAICRCQGDVASVARGSIPRLPQL